MDTMQLLERIRDKDESAFRAVMNIYGKSLYSRLYKKLGDKESTDKAFKAAMLSLYNSLTADGSTDVIEALLNSFADSAVADCGAFNEDAAGLVGFELPPEKSIAASLTKPEPELELDWLTKPMTQIQPKSVKVKPKPVAPKITAPVTEQSTENASPTQPAVARPAPTVSKQYVEENELPEEQRERLGCGWVILTVLLSVCLLATVWVIVGQLMCMGILPELDLGYSWFNENVVYWFS